MRDRTLRNGVFLAVALALLFPACNGTAGPGSGGGGDVDDGRYPRTPVGERYLSGQVELEAFTPPSASNPTATFRVKNVSGNDLEQIKAVMLFYSPSTSEGIQQYDSETVERWFNLYAGERLDLAANPRSPASVKGWELRIQFGVTTARSGGLPGTTFMDGSLECVGIEDRLTSMRPGIGFTVENVSAEAQGQLEFKLILRKGGLVVHETAWQGVGSTIPPGGRADLVPDLGGVDVGAAKAELRLRRMVL